MDRRTRGEHKNGRKIEKENGSNNNFVKPNGAVNQIMMIYDTIKELPTWVWKNVLDLSENVKSSSFYPNMQRKNLAIVYILIYLSVCNNQ